MKLLRFSSKAILVTVVVFYIVDSGIGPKLGLYVLNRFLNVAQTINRTIRRIFIRDDSFITIEIPQILDHDGCPIVISIPSSSKVTKVTNLFKQFLKPALTFLPLVTHLFYSEDNDEGLIRSIIRETQKRRRG